MTSVIRDKIMPGAEPIFFNRGKEGILFIHGFTGSPYEGRDFAEYFAQRGYTVWVPLLSGHGTHPGDLQNVTWWDWHGDAKRSLFRLRKRCKKVVVCGQSMGGSLALHLAAHYPVDAIVCFAGAVFLKDWRLKFLPLAQKFMRYQYKSKGPDIRSPSAKRKSVAYSKYPIKSIVQLLKLLAHVKQDLLDVSAPTLLIHSLRDHVVPYENMNYIHEHISSSVKQMHTLRNSYHVLSVDTEKERVFQIVNNFLKSVLRETKEEVDG